jgi:hypothetical protein
MEIRPSENLQPLGQVTGKQTAPQWWNSVADAVYSPLCMFSQFSGNHGVPVGYYDQGAPVWSALSNMKQQLQTALQAPGLSSNDKSNLENALTQLNQMQNTTPSMSFDQKINIDGTNNTAMQQAASLLDTTFQEYSLPPEAGAVIALRDLGTNI